jgi:hypothetical protein
MLIRRAATLLLALIFAAPIAAAANFPGWQRTYEQDAVTLVSPQDDYGVIQLLLGRAEQELGDPKAAFRELANKAVADLGSDLKLSQRSGMRDEGGMMVETLRVKAQGIEIDFLLFAYHTGNKFYQAGVLAYVAAIPDTDPRVNHALDFIATAARTKYRMTNPRDFDRTAPQAQTVTAYTNSQTAPKPPAPPAAPVPQSQGGKRCERRPIWGFRVSYWCQPSGICNDRVIKGYETVCE